VGSGRPLSGPRLDLPAAAGELGLGVERGAVEVQFQEIGVTEEGEVRPVDGAGGSM
jgi:hypothetical protein